MRIHPGDRLLARTASNEWIPLTAVTDIQQGIDFPVVWVCDDREWTVADAGQEASTAIPWPADAVQLRAVALDRGSLRGEA